MVLNSRGFGHPGQEQKHRRKQRLGQILSKAGRESGGYTGEKWCVRLTSKVENFEIVGDVAEIDNSSRLCVVEGQPARIVGLAQQGALSGSQIKADLNRRVF